MSAKAIREASGKDLLNRFLNQTASISRFVSVDEKTNLNDLANQHPWLLSQPLVVKPDQLIKRRGKLGLVKVNVDLNGVKEFINSHMLKDIQVCTPYSPLFAFNHCNLFSFNSTFIVIYLLDWQICR